MAPAHPSLAACLIEQLLAHAPTVDRPLTGQQREIPRTPPGRPDSNGIWQARGNPNGTSSRTPPAQRWRWVRARWCRRRPGK